MQIEPQANPAPVADQATPATEAEHEISTDTGTPDPSVSTEDAGDVGQPDDTLEVTDDEGKSERVKAEEARLGYMRDRDYRQKTMAIAEREKALADRQAKLETYVTQGEALVQALTDEFQSEFAGVNWGELAANDPAEYVRRQHAASQRQAKLQAALYRLNEAKQAQNVTNEHALKERLAQEQAVLVERLPEWKDPKRYAAESAELTEYLSKSGYKPDEVAGVTDHRAVILARKAMLYDKLAAKVPASKPVTNAPPPVPKVPTKASGEKDPSQMTDKEFREWRNRQIAQRR